MCLSGNGCHPRISPMSRAVRVDSTTSSPEPQDSSRAPWPANEASYWKRVEHWNTATNEISCVSRHNSEAMFKCGCCHQAVDRRKRRWDRQSSPCISNLGWYWQDTIHKRMRQTCQPEIERQCPGSIVAAKPLDALTYLPKCENADVHITGRN